MNTTQNTKIYSVRCQDKRGANISYNVDANSPDEANVKAVKLFQILFTHAPIIVENNGELAKVKKSN